MSDDLVTWLRQRVRERKYLAEHAVELGSNAVWTEQSSGVLVTGEPTEADTWHGTWATGDSSLTRLMEANDPSDTIARCEAELAILDEWERADQNRFNLPEGVAEGRDEDERMRDDAVAEMLDGVVRLLGSGYRHRPGYKEEAWRP